MMTPAPIKKSPEDYIVAEGTKKIAELIEIAEDMLVELRKINFEVLGESENLTSYYEMVKRAHESMLMYKLGLMLLAKFSDVPETT